MSPQRGLDSPWEKDLDQLLTEEHKNTILAPIPANDVQNRAQIPKSSRTHLLDLPRELRDMIWSYTIVPCVAIKPVDMRHRLEKNRRRPRQLLDVHLLCVNAQILEEANLALLRDSKIKLTSSGSVPIDTPSNGEAACRLKFILRNARDIVIKIPSVDPHAWWIEALGQRENLLQVWIKFTDWSGRFCELWINDREKAQDRLRVLTAIKTRHRSSVLFWAQPRLSDGRREMLEDEVVDFIIDEIEPSMTRE